MVKQASKWCFLIEYLWRPIYFLDQCCSTEHSTLIELFHECALSFTVATSLPYWCWTLEKWLGWLRSWIFYFIHLTLLILFNLKVFKFSHMWPVAAMLNSTTWDQDLAQPNRYVISNELRLLLPHHREPSLVLGTLICPCHYGSLQNVVPPKVTLCLTA